MPVYKDKKNGTYYFRVYYKDEFGNTKQTSRRGFKTKQEARDALRLFEPIREYELKKAAEEEKKKSIILFEDLIEDFFFEESKRIKITSLDANKRYFNLHIKPFFEGKDIKAIDSKNIKDWQNMMLKKNFSNKYVNQIYGILKTYFRYLENFYNLQSNPCNKVQPLREKIDVISEQEQDSKWNVVEIEEYNRFISSFDEKDFNKRCIYEVMYKAGTRVSEARALKWKDIDFTNHLIRINKQIQNIKGQIVLIAPKSQKSIRNIYISKSLENTLKELQTKEKEKYGPNIEELFVFGGMKAIGGTTVDTTRRKHIEIANVSPFRNHDLRHTFGSVLLNDGFNIKYVSEQMGHESIAITLEVYHHLLANTEETNKNKYYENY